MNYQKVERHDDPLYINESKNCERDEPASDIVFQYSEEVIRQLRKQLSATMREISAIGRARSKQYKEFDVDVNKHVRQKIKKGGAAIWPEMRLICYLIFFL
ncbi:MAG: hypothetical protein ACTSU4_04630 [Promethearchaeota archaeon]